MIKGDHMGFFEKLRQGLSKTKNAIFGRIKDLFISMRKVDEDMLDELEEILITADVGVETTEKIIAALRRKIQEDRLTESEDVYKALKEIISSMIDDGEPLDLSTKPSVVLVIGVNGVGKTTSIAKIASYLKGEGKKVILAAADTFRAAAADQLGIWADRIGVDMIRHEEGSDPASVVFDAIAASKARGADALIIDTAGRLHNKKNLMDELAKINRIIDTKSGDCSREVLLVLDATTGQNAVNQAKLFSETAPITGIVLTKLDGTAKGGIVISIKNELGIPVKLIGVGEKIDDLQPFDSRTFVEALFSDIEVEEDEEAEETEDTAAEDMDADAEAEAEDIDYEEGSDTDGGEDEEAAEEVTADGIVNTYTDDKGYEHVLFADGSEHVYDEEGSEIIGYEEENNEPEEDDSDLRRFDENGVEDLDYYDRKRRGLPTDDPDSSEDESAGPDEDETEDLDVTEDNDAPEKNEETGEKSESLIYAGGYVYDENYMSKFDDDFAYDDEVAEEDRETAETEEESGSEPEENAPVAEKKKKRGFFSRLFGRKKSEEDEEEDSDEDADDEDDSDEDQ